jgi:hypothetical protein
VRRVTGAATKFWSFPEGAELGDAQVFLVEAPACRQGGRAEVDVVDAEPVELLKRRELPGDAFDEVREALGLGIVVGNGEDVCQIIGMPEVIVVGSQSILGTFREDHLPADATMSVEIMRCGWRAQAGRVASACPSRSAACRSSWGSSPPMGDTSRISMESRSRPVRTRWRPSTSSRLTSDSHRSRLRLCGWPVSFSKGA